MFTTLKTDATATESPLIGYGANHTRFLVEYDCLNDTECNFSTTKIFPTFANNVKQVVELNLLNSDDVSSKIEVRNDKNDNLVLFVTNMIPINKKGDVKKVSAGRIWIKLGAKGKNFKQLIVNLSDLTYHVKRNRQMFQLELAVSSYKILSDIIILIYQDLPQTSVFHIDRKVSDIVEMSDRHGNLILSFQCILYHDPHCKPTSVILWNFKSSTVSRCQFYFSNRKFQLKPDPKAVQPFSLLVQVIG